jgi:hypothetical protein
MLSRFAPAPTLEHGFAGVTYDGLQDQRDVSGYVKMLNINLRTSATAAIEAAKVAFSMASEPVFKLEVLEPGCAEPSLVILPLLSTNPDVARAAVDAGCPLLRIMGSAIGARAGIADEPGFAEICSLPVPVVLFDDGRDPAAVVSEFAQAAARIFCPGRRDRDGHNRSGGTMMPITASVAVWDGQAMSLRRAKLPASAAEVNEGDLVVVVPGVACGRCAIGMSFGSHEHLCPHRVVHGFSAYRPDEFFAIGGYATHIELASDIAVAKVPEGMAWARAVLAEMVSIAVRAAERGLGQGRPDLGMGSLVSASAAVLGLGPVGSAVALVLQALGLRVTGFEVNPWRAAHAARRLGIDARPSTRRPCTCSAGRTSRSAS